jgi:hypothetical protein
LILNDIRVGLDRWGKNYELIVDRREAILHAIAQAKAGDIVLIAGKGHETYQILASGKIHFDDREVAREALQLRVADDGLRNSKSKRSPTHRQESGVCNPPSVSGDFGVKRFGSQSKPEEE